MEFTYDFCNCKKFVLITLVYLSVLFSLLSHHFLYNEIFNQSCVVFLTIRYQSGRKYNIDWEALVHAIVTGTGGSFCVLLDMNIIPQSSYVRCHASTPLHNILPAVTQGYAICDILNGLEFGGAFLAHGIATLMLTSLFSMLGFAYMLSPMLVCEVSVETRVKYFLR